MDHKKNQPFRKLTFKTINEASTTASFSNDLFHVRFIYCANYKKDYADGKCSSEDLMIILLPNKGSPYNLLFDCVLKTKATSEFFSVTMQNDQLFDGDIENFAEYLKEAAFAIKETKRLTAEYFPGVLQERET